MCTEYASSWSLPLSICCSGEGRVAGTYAREPRDEYVPTIFCELKGTLYVPTPLISRPTQLT